MHLSFDSDEIFENAAVLCVCVCEHNFESSYKSFNMFCFKNQDIIPFIDKYWECMTTRQRKLPTYFQVQCDIYQETS